MNLDKLQDTDEKLYEISKKFSFTSINPNNVSKERNKVLNDKFYNPQFDYTRYKYSTKLLLKKLSRIKCDHSAVGKLLEQKKDELKEKIMMIRARGSPEFTQHAVNVYGQPSPELVDKALVYFDGERKVRKANINMKHAIGQIEKAFLKLRLDWEVKQKVMVSSAVVRISDRLLFLKRGQKFSKEHIQRLIVHEINSHVLRAENGRLQPLRMFAVGFPGYLGTEEGLSIINEEKFGILRQHILKNYAGRAIAVNLALDNSFSFVYNHLLKYFDKLQAFRLTLRAKRGVSDTSEPGGCTKDYLYMQGYLDLKKYMKRGNLANLYYGKIGLEHIHLIKKIPGLVKPVYLPQFLKRKR